MKAWVKKLVEQFEVDDKKPRKKNSEVETKSEAEEISDSKATLMYVLDCLNAHLLEFENHPQRKTREKIDRYLQQLVATPDDKLESVLFDVRQFYSGYRIAEHSFVQKNFDDLKKIIWEFADQLGEDLQDEKRSDEHLKNHFQELKEAVDSNSLESLKKKSREFIHSYIEMQSEKNEKKTKRLTSLKRNMTTVKKQLLEAHHTLRVDHLTQAYNRKSFDEQLKKYVQMTAVMQTPITLLILDIDHFKKINDSYGHDIGDFILIECVRLLKEVFTREDQLVYRIGGEEFAILLPDYKTEPAKQKCEEVLQKIRKQVFVHGELKIQFTMSIGLAEHQESEKESEWLKRADSALYLSKNNGRDKCTVAGISPAKLKVA